MGLEMTPEQLALLTPRQREVVGLRASGLSVLAVAERLGIKPPAVWVHEWQARGRIERAKGPVEPRGEKARKYHHDESETPLAARKRVARELAEGKRCRARIGMGPCSLLLPCADHDLALGLAT